MEDMLTREGVAWIVETILAQAQKSIEEYDGEKNEYYYGRMLAYYELIDAMQGRIKAREGNPADYGLDINVDDLENELKKRIKPSA